MERNQNLRGNNDSVLITFCILFNISYIWTCLDVQIIFVLLSIIIIISVWRLWQDWYLLTKKNLKFLFQENPNNYSKNMENARPLVVFSFLFFWFVFFIRFSQALFLFGRLLLLFYYYNVTYMLRIYYIIFEKKYNLIKIS